MKFPHFLSTGQIEYGTSSFFFTAKVVASENDRILKVVRKHKHFSLLLLEVFDPFCQTIEIPGGFFLWTGGYVCPFLLQEKHFNNESEEEMSPVSYS